MAGLFRASKIMPGHDPACSRIPPPFSCLPLLPPLPKPLWQSHAAKTTAVLFACDSCGSGTSAALEKSRFCSVQHLCGLLGLLKLVSELEGPKQPHSHGGFSALPDCGEPSPHYPFSVPWDALCGWRVPKRNVPRCQRRSGSPLEG